MDKQRLRRALREQLGALTSETARVAAARVAARVLSLPTLARPVGVLTCLSFGTELDTEPLVTGLGAAGHRIYVPRTHAPTRALTVHRYPCPTEVLSFGLRQPTDTVPAVAVDEAVDVALILGLAFDRDGYRLGHGGGYFDRFLARHRVHAVGLAHALQLVARVPREAHDVPMATVVTDEAVIDCRAGTGRPRGDHSTN